MDPTVAPPLRPSSATITTTAHTYLHSNDFSPRSRTTESWNEDNSIYPSIHGSSSSAASGGGSIKLRLMCSSGGHIVPRPHDKTLCYVGGETRMVVVDRHTTLLDLTNRLSKTLLRSSSSSTATSVPTSSFTLKYQLPSEDLDSLISVTTDEDLENMIEEYERLNSSSAKSSRLRLFLFPTKPESVSSITSFLENSTKSEDWFLSALNGTESGFSDTSSVNYLLGLDDEISIHEKKDVNNKGTVNSNSTNFRGNNSGQDVHSIPDSPMMETTSSFGSASSTPSLANLPPIAVNVDDHPKVVGGIQEQFSQMSVQERHHKNDGGFIAAPTPVAVSGSPAIPENSDPFLSYQSRSDQGLEIAYIQQPQQFQQKQSTGFDLASSDSVLSDQLSPLLQIQSSVNTNRSTDLPASTDQNTRIQIQQQQQIQNSSYLLPIPTTQIDAQHPQLHQQQLQFIHTAVPPPQYLHHHPSPAVVPVPPYYQMYHSQGHHQPQNPPIGQQNFVYYMPHQGYNFPMQQQQSTDPEIQIPPNNQPAPKPEFPAGVYRRTNSGPPQLVRIPSGNQYGGGGNFAYEGQHLYYGQQGMQMPPVSSAQFQPMTSTSTEQP